MVTRSISDLESSEIVPACLSYPQLRDMAEEKLTAVNAKVDVPRIYFESLGYHKSRARIDTSVGLTQAFHIWWSEPSNRRHDQRTGLLTWWLLIKEHNEKGSANLEEVVEMPDFEMTASPSDEERDIEQEKETDEAG